MTKSKSKARTGVEELREDDNFFSRFQLQLLRQWVVFCRRLQEKQKPVAIINVTGEVDHEKKGTKNLKKTATVRDTRTSSTLTKESCSTQRKV